MAEESKSKGGRPPHAPTARTKKQVQVMAAMGLTQKQMARIMGLGVDSLIKFYKEEVEAGADVLNAEVAGTLYRMATSGKEPAATFFWLKTRAGWRERQDINLTIDQVPDDKLLAILGASQGAGTGATGSDETGADSS